jgi:dienelactone hydrolase
MACQAPLAVCVEFDGGNPTPIEQVEHIAGPVLGFYGGEDNRINQTLDQLIKAMSTYKKYFEMRIDPGAAPCLL